MMNTPAPNEGRFAKSGIMPIPHWIRHHGVDIWGGLTLILWCCGFILAMQAEALPRFDAVGFLCFQLGAVGWSVVTWWLCCCQLDIE